MANNIFEGVKFGDKFLTRDGRDAVFYGFCKLEGYVNLVVEKEGILLYRIDGAYHLDGRIDDIDIVSRYQEPIDEDKLDELAIESMNKSIFNDPNKNDCGCDTAYYYGFVAGYRKAMEE